jgi:Polyketide cyclase / dehydrase and lipid transport
MGDFERSTTVGVGADAAFAYLSDPDHAPEYVSAMTLVDSIAIDGELPPEAEERDRDAAPEVRFLADAAARRVEWGLGGADYSGSMSVTPGTTSTSQITLRLHLRDDADPGAVERMLDQTVRNLQRLLSGR